MRLFEDALSKVEWPEGETARVVAALPREAQDYIEHNYLLSQINFRYWAERYCYISSSSADLVTLTLRPSQEMILDCWKAQEEANHPLRTGKIALIVAKCRRAGATVIAQAALAHGVMLRPQAMGFTASDIPESSLNLFHVQERIFDNLPKWMKPHVKGRVKSEHFHFEELDSKLELGSGAQKNPMGQGLREDFIHLTEMSTWLYPAQVKSDLLPAFLSSDAPTCFFMQESTGKGGKGNYFYEAYQQAKRKEGYFRHLFIGWFMVKEIHSLPSEGVTFTPTTIEHAERIKRENGYECTRDQLAWYQVTREEFEASGDLQDFLAEYASCDDEAFQHGVKSAFPIELRMRMRDAVKAPVAVCDWQPATKKFEPAPVEEWREKEPSTIDTTNRLFIWEWARPGFIYLLCADASVGLEGGDNAAVEVIRVGNRVDGPEQVAEFAGTVDPLTLADVVQYIGFLYPDKDLDLPCKAIVEITGPGLGTQLQLQRLGYGHFYMHRRPLDAKGGHTTQLGWQTNIWTREAVTTLGVEVLRKRQLKVNSPAYIEEMGTYGRVLNKAGTKVAYDHAPGCFDDRLMSSYIALYVAQEPDSIFLAEEAGRRITVPTAAMRSGPKPTPQSVAVWDGQPVTSETMWDLIQEMN